MPAISVIVPCYNTQQFLPRCLESLQRQSFQDWEAICVDDGSTDGTSALLDSYAEKDKRFVVLHKHNEGVSIARNKALELAQGAYILFVDSDDFLHPDAMRICYNLAIRDKSDLVAFTYNRTYRTCFALRHFLGIKDTPVKRYPTFLENPPTLLTDNLLEWATEYSHPHSGQDSRWLVKHCQPWRCLYKADTIRDIRFIPGIIYEDFPWWSHVLQRTKNATILNLPLYYYYPNAGSYINAAAQSYRIRSLQTAIPAAKKIFETALPEQYSLWEARFLVPFQQKLQRKLKRTKNE